jgi:methyl-accepting chemotaxis protein
MTTTPSPPEPITVLPMATEQTAKSSSVNLFRSVGTRLFLLVMGGALVGLSGVAFLFYNNLRQEVEAGIQTTLGEKVAQINGEMKQAEGLANSLRDAVASLHKQGVQSREIYEKLTLELFLGRPKSVIGFGFGQDANGVLNNPKWFYPYYAYNPGSLQGPGVKLPPPNDNIRYSSVENSPKDFYPEQDYWQEMIIQKSYWADPYDYFGVQLSSFYAPIFDANKKWIATAAVDYNADAFNDILKGTVAQEAGFFAVVSTKGTIISYPSDIQKVLKAESYQKIPGLAAIWNQIKQQKSGLVQAQGTYWAYAQTSQYPDWIVLAAVPTNVVLGPAIGITVGGAIAAALLLALITALMVRYLNQRLQPILDTCNQLAATDASTELQLAQQDEIGRLSTSFFNLLDQVKANEERIRQEVARSVQTNEQLKQAEQEKAESDALQRDVGNLLDVVLAVEEGDLTVQAAVSDRPTGLVADTFNRLVEELARIMTVVSSTAQQVTQSAAGLEQLSDRTAQQSVKQTQAVGAVQVLIQDVNQLTQNNVQQTADANLAVVLAQTAVAEGEEQINALTGGIDTLQTGAEQITRRVQTLADFVQLAVQFVKEQKRTAAMTRVLALNASLLSARATEQQDPEQFASIAKEFETITAQVNNLAIETNQGLILLQQRTDQIQTVVSGLSQDVQDINQIVHEFTAGVGHSGQVFDDIRDITTRLGQVEQRVTESSQAIAQAALKALESVQDIAAITMINEQQAETAREQAGAMGQLSRELLQMVNFFRVSSTPMQASRTPTLLPAESNGSDSSSTNRHAVLRA